MVTDKLKDYLAAPFPYIAVVRNLERVKIEEEMVIVKPDEDEHFESMF